ncbi:hypothetical protein N7450_004339 [Penicillium hetheringtonii]|uniref:Zn(2)-C6 fungal-type domain-containing protein n=1 Tax=Penicillium hetheringtonii TaxID=911720 RepID=A0AAD6DR70_9EURO|nr:hypothetical protein N7450_004339 [Penicillium hetheringtonii]
MTSGLSRVELGSHTRSFTGCATCRSRHVKCDEGRPTCSMCSYFGLKCAGYKKDLFFDSKNPNSRIRFRRPLLTEEERIRMSQWLITSAPPKSTQRLLSQIDEQCEDVAASDEVELTYGPFGVFRVPLSRNEQITTPSNCDRTSPVEEIEDATDTSPQTDIIPMIDPFPAVSGMGQWSPDFMQSLLGQSDGDISSTSPDLLDLIMDQVPFDDTTLAHPNCQLTSTSLISDLYCNPPTSPPSLTPAPVETRALPQDATPWHVLFIPHAKDCLAALAMGEELNHANLCAFYGTLATSAFSLGGVSRSQTWLDQGHSYMRQAQEHAKIMLMTAYNIPKPAKYKSILMAILTMVQLSNFCGNRNDAEGFFLEAEKFIRLKGLKRRKSRKVRLLHHCYVFERMFHESIFIGGANSNQRRQIRRAIESSGLAPASVDSLSFRLYKWKNLHQEMLRVRDREEGENDLHLERPGMFSATLYPEIFGIPEPCRSKALEDYINCLERPNQVNFGLGTHQSSVDQHILENMLEAMRQALAIYFYRRIYDLDASMLQKKVVDVRDCLLQCEYADSSVVHGSAGFIWPAFIAACEAEDSKVQESFSAWFQMSAQRSGLSCFAQTQASIEKIWQEKRDANGSSVTWVDLMKKSVSLQQ